MSYIKGNFLLTTKTAEKLYKEYASEMPIFDYHCHLPEKAILENLRNMRSGKTTLLIAHRVSTIEQMDKIIFVEEGRIAAVGNYAELYEGCPEFKNLVDLQKLDDADEGDTPKSENDKEVE